MDEHTDPTHQHDHEHQHVHDDEPRAASVRLRAEEGSQSVSERQRMDTANQSLADALRITYGLLKAAMVVLVVLFVVSGVQSINEGERGIAVRFGKPVRQNLEPGFAWSFPYPIGEIVRVESGTVELPVAAAFMPNLPGDNSLETIMGANIERFNSSSSLKPGSDGSNITADLNIAHTQWTINYRRADHAEFVSNIYPENERRIIHSAVRQAVVHVMAETTIDDLLKNSSESISNQVREQAQRTLNGIGSGIEIDRVVLTRKNAALSLRSKFSSVQTAAQNAGKQREDALLLRDQLLNEVAGRASTLLVEQINEYERLIELGEADEAEAQLARIDAILEGRPVEIDGETIVSLVSGEVSELLKDAQTQASNRVNNAIAQLENFRSKLAQYEANPKLMIARDWSSAMGEFLDKDSVSTILLPEGVDAEVFINNDPDIARELDRIRKRREAEEAEDLRREEMRRSWYRSQRGIQEPED